MGVFTRPDSAYWWLYLPTTKRKERTAIVVGTTTSQRHDSKRLATELFHQRMNELSARLYRLPSAQPAIRFDKYAATYRTDTIPHQKGSERALTLLAPLVAFLGDDLLTAIDVDRTKQYLTHRRITGTKVSARTANREVDLLKAMVRDAVPKYLTASPLVGMKRLSIVPPKRRLMTAAEERKLLDAATRTERALLILGIDGLIRLTDILDIKRSDRHGDWLYIADPKSGHAYEVVLTVRAGKALDAIPGTGTYFFQRYRGAATERDRRGRVRQVLKALCKRAGVPYGRAIGGITFHWATRKTGATRLLLDARAPIPAVQRQGNWKTPEVLLGIYAEADRDAQRNAIRPKRAGTQREWKMAKGDQSPRLTATQVGSKKRVSAGK